jgi:ABC-type nitrate/sulfonate/bicarbonate transport system substrate-binding protein
MIKIGFIPLADCAPLVVAQELGYFLDEGLEVHLAKAQSWDQLRSRLESGDVQAAHLLATLPLLSAFGIGGGACPVVTAWTLSQCGNAITLSNRLCREGVRTGVDLRQFLSKEGAPRSLRFGVVHPRSTHELMLREWLSAGGQEIGNRVELVTSPPQEMVRRLREGEIDGFCAGEPWNQRATTSKLGGIVAFGEEIMPASTEKVLAVRQDWHEANKPVHAALLRALSKASAWLGIEENLPQAARWLCDKKNVNTQEGILLSALRRELQAGWGKVATGRRFLRFTGPGVNRPDVADFRWYLERLVLWGHLQPQDLELDLERICLSDFHREVFPLGDGSERLLPDELDLEESLERIPCAVRRKLSLSGSRISTDVWCDIPLSLRRQLFLLPADTQAEIAEWAGHLKAACPQVSGSEGALTHASWRQKDHLPFTTLPDGTALDLPQWRSLDELVRFRLWEAVEAGHLDPAVAELVR